MSFKDPCLSALQVCRALSPSRPESQPAVTGTSERSDEGHVVRAAAWSRDCPVRTGFVPRPLGALVSGPVFILGAATAQDRPFLLGEISQAEMSRCFLDDMRMVGKEASWLL